jgi:lipid II:glycine glycyltransferase (peptidoglycan interpeptide bridge formation enzyme)
MKLYVLNEDKKELHDELAKHPLQSWQWGRFREENGQRVLRLGYGQEDRFSEVHQISLHKIPLTPWYLGYCPRGPLPSAGFLAELKILAKKLKLLAIKFEPNVWEILKNSEEENKDINNKLIKKTEELCLKPGKNQFTPYSFILPLEKTEEELLASFASKTRYNIRLAQKKEVYVKDATDEKGLAVFLKLMEETSSRQGFYAHKAQYFRLMYKHLLSSGTIKILHACHGEDVLSAWILFKWKNFLYYPYGASSTVKRELMANNLIMWEAIRYGKKENLAFFDMWGCMGPNPATSDPWFGFHRFKKGYNPDQVQFVGSWDLVIRPILWKIFSVLDKLRWAILRARRS